MSDLSHVSQWWTLPDVVESLGVRLQTVRRWVEDREVVGVRRGENNTFQVPRAFFDDQGPVPALKGTFTVLADGGMDDAEIIGWLFEPDPTLPVQGAPMDAVLAGFKTEVRRRAMESAF